MPDINWIKEKTTPIAIRYGLQRMYLFGSYAKGTAIAKSDRIERRSDYTLITLKR